MRATATIEVSRLSLEEVTRAHATIVNGLVKSALRFYHRAEGEAEPNEKQTESARRAVELAKG